MKKNIFILICILFLPISSHYSLNTLAPVSISKTSYVYDSQSIVNLLLSKGMTTLTADDGKEFQFAFEKLSDSTNKDMFLIEVKTEGKLIGYVHVYANWMKRSFGHVDAILVWPEWRKKYRGIGSALMILALAISKELGYQQFELHEIAAVEFFTKKFAIKSKMITNDIKDGLVFDLNSIQWPLIKIDKKADISNERSELLIKEAA